MLDQLPIINELPPGWRELVARLLLIIFAFVLTWLLRRIITWMVFRPLRRLLGRNNTANDEAILDVIVTPVRYTVLAVALLAGLEIFGVGDALDNLFATIARTLLVIALLLLIYRLVDLFASSSRRVLMVTGIHIEDRILPFVRTSIKLVIITLGIMILLQEWGYNISGLIAGFGLGGLAISLAAQDTVSNLFGFAAIVSDDPFDIGEYIVTPDVEGLVEHVGLRSTRIRQLDQAVVYVPNNKLANSAILNWSRLKKRRIDYVLGVTYDSTSGDIRVLLHRLREYFKAQPTVDPDSIVIYFLNFGESALEILVRAYVMLPDWAEFTAEKERLNLEVLNIVNSLDMSIAFPSTSLYIENLPTMFAGAQAPEEAPKPSPKLSPRERALMQGLYHEVTPKKPVDPEENITNQQDEGDDGR